MAQAQGSRVGLSYAEEVTAGTTPAIAFTDLRFNTTNIDPKIANTTSQEIRSDRAVADLVRTSGTTDGEFTFELTFTEYRPFMYSALGSAVVTVFNMVAATTVSFAAGDNSINDSAVGFNTTTIKPGYWIRVTGSVANSRLWKVVSVTTAKVVVSHGTIVTEAAGPSVNVRGRSARNGTTKNSYSIQRAFPDIVQYCIHRGMMVNTMTINASSGAIITGSFGLMGRDSDYATSDFSTGAHTVSSTNSIMSAVANVGTVYIDGVATSGVYFKSINLSTTNNLRNLDAIGNLYPIDINFGNFGATIAIEAYFNDTTLLDKFLAGTEMAFVYSFTDVDNKSFVFDFPKVKLDTGTLSGIQINSEVMQSLSLTALYSSVSGYMAQISTCGTE